MGKIRRWYVSLFFSSTFRFIKQLYIDYIYGFFVDSSRMAVEST